MKSERRDQARIEASRQAPHDPEGYTTSEARQMFVLGTDWADQHPVTVTGSEPSDAEVEELASGMWAHSGDGLSWDDAAEKWLELARFGLRALRANPASDTSNTPIATNA